MLFGIFDQITYCKQLLEGNATLRWYLLDFTRSVLLM
jgi:hypothetical protein